MVGHEKVEEHTSEVKGVPIIGVPGAPLSAVCKPRNRQLSARIWNQVRKKEGVCPSSWQHAISRAQKWVQRSRLLASWVINNTKHEREPVKKTQNHELLQVSSHFGLATIDSACRRAS
jgi:hypothetical protein